MLRAAGLTGLAWSGRADVARIASADGLPAAITGRAVDRPALVAIVWARDADWLDPSELLGEAPRRELLVLSNRDGDDTIGPAGLAELVERFPVVRRRVPSLLGIRDLPPGGAGWDASAARALARVFVPTHAYDDVLAVLEQHYFAVVTGPPEMGKTAIARTLGLALELEGWEVHECIRPEQVLRALARDRRQLFVADDAFGSTEYRPDAAEQWALELDRILRALDDRHWLVWTSRPAPLKAGLGRVHREHGLERFPQPAQISVDAARLDVEEKATILYRHARAAKLPPFALHLVRSRGANIVAHRHFTPERINRFIGTRVREFARSPGRLDELIDAELAEPTDAMRVSLRTLGAEHRSLLVALLDAPPGAVPERELVHAVRRHASHSLTRPPGELVDRLTDHFVRLVPPTGVTWVHPSWRDLVIEELAADPSARRSFLERCGIDGALLALSRAGGAEGERTRPLLVRDEDWDALTERLYELVPGLADPELARLLTALEDGLAAGDEDEVAALASVALKRIADCWTSGRSFASESLLQRWREVSARLPQPPAELDDVHMWRPPPVIAPPPAVRAAATASIPAVSWRDGDDAIVARILADL